MNPLAGKSTQQLLDEVRRPEQIDAFAVEGFVQRLELELASGATGAAAAEDRDALLRTALAAIDSFASQLMRIRLDHLLVGYASIERPFRKYLAGRVLDYEGNTDRLRARVAEVATRVDADSAAEVAAGVADAADEVLTLRARLRQGVLALVPPDSPEQEPPPPRTRVQLIELD